MKLSPEILNNIKNSTKEVLDISYSDMSDEQSIEKLVETLNENEKIKTLKLYQCSVNDKGAAILAGAKHLTYLDLTENNIGPDGTISLAKNKNLIKLNLSGNQIGLDGATALAKNKKLEELIIAGCKLGDDGAIAMLSTNSDVLTKLDLNTNDISNVGVNVKNQTLTDLNLSQNYIDSDGAVFIASNFTNLTSLNLGTNSVGNHGAIALASHKKLVNLDLSQNQVAEEGFRALCSNEEIQTLCLHGNQIDFGRNESLPSNNSITNLNLSYNKIKDKPENPLQSIASFSKLKELMLDENKISYDVAKRFYDEITPKLEVVDLRSCTAPMLFSYKRKKTEALADDFSSSKIMKLSI